MNLEDLILDTQISELKRLQTRCTEARSGIEKIRARLADLNEQSEKSLGELRVRHTEELNNAVALLDAEAQKHRDHAVASSDSLKVGARRNRERLLGELHSRLQQDIWESRRKLQADLEALQAINDSASGNDSVEATDAGNAKQVPVTLEIHATAIDLAENDSAVVEPEAIEPLAVAAEKVEPEKKESEEPIGKRRKGSRKSKAIEAASSRVVTSEQSDRSGSPQTVNDDAASERVDFDEADQLPKQAQRKTGWTGGWRLFVLCLLIFFIVTIGSALSRIDLGTAMTFVFSEADLIWAGVSSLIGLGAALLVGLTLRFIGSRKQRNVVAAISAAAISKAVEATAVSEVVADPAEENADSIAGEISIDDSTDFVAASGGVVAIDHQGSSPLSVSSLISSSPIAGVPEQSAEATRLLFSERFQKVAELKTASDSQVNELIHRYTQQIGLHVEKVEDQVINGSNATAEALQSIDAWRSQELARVQQHYKAEFDRVHDLFLQDSRIEPQRLTDEARTIYSRWKANFTIACELARIIRDRATVYPAWSELASKPWSAPATVPVTLTVGDIRATFPAAPDYPDGDINSELIMDLPGVVNFPQNCSIAVRHDSDSRESSLEFVNGILLRLLTSLAPKTTKLSLIDPISQGDCFNGLRRLAEFNNQLIDVCASDESEIFDRLQDITDRIESVQLACLQSDSKSIQEHNAKAGTIPIPYHFVVLTGFSKNVSEAAAGLLTSILNEGPRCGIHMILVWSADQEVPRSFDLGNVGNCCVLFYANNGAVLPGLSPSQRPVENSNPFVEFTALTPPDATVYARLISAVGGQCRGEGSVAAAADIVPPVEQTAEFETVEEASVVVNSEVTESKDVVVKSDEVVSVAETVAVSEVGESEVDVTESVRAVEDGSSTDALVSEEVEQTFAPVTAEHGAVAARMEDCVPLRGFLVGASADARISSGEVPVWLGEEDGSNVPFGMKLQRSRGQNLLVVGQDRDLADSILAASVLSLCAGSTAAGKPRSSCMVLLHDQQDQTSFGKFSASFSRELVPGLTLRGVNDAETLVTVLLKEMASREASKDASDSPEIVFAVRDIGQYPCLRREDENSGSIGFGSPKSSTPMLKFSDLIRRGPQVGIHVLLWADTLNIAMQSLSHSLLREFDSRIALCMNADDSNSLIGNSDAASLSPGRAIFYVDPAGTIERFRPFEWPSDEWLAAASKFPVVRADEMAVVETDMAMGEVPPLDAVVSGSHMRSQPIAEAAGFTEVPVSDSFVVANPVIAADSVTDFVEELSVPEAPAFLGPVNDNSVPDFMVSEDVPAAVSLLSVAPAMEIPFADHSQLEATLAESTVSQPSVSENTVVASRTGEHFNDVSGTSPDSVPESPSAPVIESLAEPEASAIPSPVVAKPAPLTPKLPFAVPPAPAASSEQSAATPPSRPKKLSAMAARLAARNSDASRPLDAPPDRQAQASSLSVPKQPAPDSDFDELDFNSIMIE